MVKASSRMMGDHATFFVAILICSGIDFSSGQTSTADLLLVKSVARKFVNRLAGMDRGAGIDWNRLNEMYIAPKLPDPDCYAPFSVPVKVAVEEPPVKISGQFNTTTEAKVYGFSKMEDTFMLTYIPHSERLRAHWDFSIPILNAESAYLMDLDLDIGTKVLKAWGEGPLTGSIENLHLNMRVEGRAPPGRVKMSISFVDIRLGFTNFKMDGGPNAKVGSVHIDWQKISESVQQHFDSMWEDQNRFGINGMLQCAFHHAISGCSLRQVTRNNSCIRTELNKRCFRLAEEKRSVMVQEVEELDTFPSVTCPNKFIDTNNLDETNSNSMTQPGSGHSDMGSVETPAPNHGNNGGNAIDEEVPVTMAPTTTTTTTEASYANNVPNPDNHVPTAEDTTSAPHHNVNQHSSKKEKDSLKLDSHKKSSVGKNPTNSMGGTMEKPESEGGSGCGGVVPFFSNIALLVILIATVFLITN